MHCMKGTVKKRKNMDLGLKDKLPPMYFCEEIHTVYTHSFTSQLMHSFPQCKLALELEDHKQHTNM